jgi:hypothetical protein
MYEHRLGQTLILKPDVEFSVIDSIMTKAGWHKTKLPSNTEPLLSGEPEHMTWSWHGGKPFVVYTFNPVAKLRVLDVATLPPSKRAELAQQIGVLNDEELEKLFSSSDPKHRLLGLWAVGECQRLDLAHLVHGLLKDKETIIRNQSEIVADKFKHIADERVKVLSSLRLIASAAEKVIRDIHQHPDLIQALIPSIDDCRELFDESFAQSIQQAVKKTFASVPNLDPGSSYRHLEVNAANAGLLRWPNELSEKFPRGYRDVAGWMKPDKVWLCWSWVEPLADENLISGEFSRSAKRVSFDGLAWVKDHWVWLPKMHRIIKPVLDIPDETIEVVH